MTPGSATERGGPPGPAEGEAQAQAPKVGRACAWGGRVDPAETVSERRSPGLRGARPVASGGRWGSHGGGRGERGRWQSCWGSIPPALAPCEGSPSPRQPPRPPGGHQCGHGRPAGCEPRPWGVRAGPARPHAAPAPPRAHARPGPPLALGCPAHTGSLPAHPAGPQELHHHQAARELDGRGAREVPGGHPAVGPRVAQD